jgi:nucleotide-binding universal stress UspA family protein
MIAIKNILVATDFSRASDSALEYGRQLALNFGAGLHVLYVVETSPFRAGADGMTYDISLIQESMEQDGRKALADLLGPDNNQPPATTAVVKTAPSAALAIADYAQSADINLIVIGTHGRGFVGHLLMGSVAERVVRIAPCPVLTVRNPEHEFVRPDALQVAARQTGR